MIGSCDIHLAFYREGKKASEEIRLIGRWATNKVVTLYGWDAGTDSGPSYVSPDQITVPRGIVTEFSGFPVLVNGVLLPFGNDTFTRLD